jgi:tetratricopeptide (TPR) repeat protein
MPPDLPEIEVIRNALEKIVTSPQMESSPSLCRFLRYVVEETLAGRGGQIKEYSLGVEVFSRGDDFDPRVDPIVRVQARNLRARMAKYYEGPGATEPVLIDLPKRTYVPVFAARQAETAAPQSQPEAEIEAVPQLAPPQQNVSSAPKRTPVRIVAAVILIALAGGALSWPLRPALSKAPHQTDPAAQDQYVRGCFLMDRHSEQSLREGVACFERAIAKDAQFAAAYAGLADAYNLLAQYGYVQPSEAMETARAAAKQALTLDPGLAEGHVALAAITEAYDWNWTAAEREYRRAIELNPALPAAHLWYGMFLRDQGRLNEGIAELRRAARLEPVSEMISVNFASALMSKGDYSAALEQAQTASELNPNSVSSQLLLANVYRCLARKADAEAALARAEEAAGDNPHGLSALAGIYAHNGRLDKGALLMRRLQDLAKQRYVSPFDLACVSLVLGDENRALELFEEAYRQRSTGMIFLRNAKFASVRQKEQFQQLIEKMHFAG